MSDALVSFRTAVADGNYASIKLDTTHPRRVAPPIVSPVASLNEDRRRRFTELADEWEQNTRFVSSVTDIVSHPAYRAIIAMGQSALSLILERLEAKPSFWFQALHEISGDNPVRTEDAGDLELMTMAWLDWGDKHNYR